ncbi:DNAJB14 isoform 5, partial [Pan troglodytes]
FSNGRAGYSQQHQHRHSGHEREEERGDQFNYMKWKGKWKER